MSREPAIPDNVSSPLRTTWQGEHSRLRHAITNAKHKGKNAMKLVGFEANGKARLGFVEGEGVIDLSAADASLSADITEVLVRSGGDLGFLRDVAKKSKDRRPLKGLAYTLPVTNPGKIICLGLNYLEHAKEGGHKTPEAPSIFMRCLTSLVAHEQPIIRPKASTMLDYECELAVLIGKRGRHVA
jgi:acylpyruvate hydrolase